MWRPNTCLRQHLTKRKLFGVAGFSRSVAKSPEVADKKALGQQHPDRSNICFSRFCRINIQFWSMKIRIDIKMTPNMLDPYMNDWSHGPNLSVTPKVFPGCRNTIRTSISASSASLSVELSLLSSRYICLQMHNDLSTFYQRLARKFLSWKT